MRRSRRGGSKAPQAEACDVWLDTAELKQSSAQAFIAKPKASSRVLERKLTSVAFTQTKASQPRTKQTTISTFFHRQTDEKDKENSKPSPFILKKDCKEKDLSLTAFPVKILALPRMEEVQKQSFRAGEETVQVAPQHCAQTAPASPTPVPASWLAQAESHGTSETSCGVGEDSYSSSFTQDSEGNRIIAHRQESDLFVGEMISASGIVTLDCRINKGERQQLPEETNTRLHLQARCGASQRKNPQRSSSVNPFTAFTGTENVPPPRRRASTCAARLDCSPHRPTPAQPLRERSQNTEEGQGSEVRLSSSCRHLFTQDSEGYRVIAHHCQQLPSPHQEHGSSAGQLPTSPYKGWSSDAAERSWSNLGKQELDVCYDLLFTQDSEGNRVIKH